MSTCRGLLASGCFGGAVGWLAWGGEPGAVLLWVLLLPVAYGFARSRDEAGVLMLGYYLSVARGLPGGAIVFFGDSAPWFAGWGMWGAASLLLASPFAFCWSKKAASRGRGFVLALCVVAVPPLGLLGWCTPLAASGVLFPGMAWGGLLVCGGLLGMLAAAPGLLRPAVTAAVLAVVLAIGANRAWQPPVPPQGWGGMDTGFSRLASGDDVDAAGRRLAAMGRVEWVKEMASAMPANATLLLPETLLGPFGAMAEFALRDAERALEARGSRIVVGAELAQQDGRYINGLVVLGTGAVEKLERRVVRQSIPVPVGMWKPWAKDGAVATFLGEGAVSMLDDERVAGVICYEQLLPWVFFLRFAQRPTVLLAAANVWWARGTSIPAIQQATIFSFARLFGVPVLSAVNS